MYGISSSGKEAIGLAVDRMFDRLTYNLLGNIPQLQKKSFMFGISPEHSLAKIFITTLGNKEPNQLQKDVLKSLLNSSFGYIEGLKHRTSSNIMEAVDALAKESRANNTKVSVSQISEVLMTEMEKAKNAIKTIAEAETTKTRNIGHTMEIATNAGSAGIVDPTVFFIVIKDRSLCNECRRLHLLSDGVTPRVWKMSDLSMGYHKRGEDHPSSCGEHPNCRCTLAHLYPGWGFKNGFIDYIAIGHDEYLKQNP